MAGTLYSTPTYRMGAQGYLLSKAQPGLLVAANAIADPAPVAGVNELIGFADNPSSQRSEGAEPVNSLGSMRTVCVAHGLRTYSLNTRFIVGDGTFCTYAARDHSDPDKLGTVMGLPLRTYEYGTSQAFGAAAAEAEQALDTLINSLSLDFREGQPVTATVDMWPTVILDQGVTPQASYTPMSCPVLHWCHLEWTVGGIDYTPILSGCSFRLQNGLQRIGVRKQFGAITTEPNISRTAYAIIPGIEQLGLQPSWRDKLPAALRQAGDWSTITMRAEVPGVGIGRRYLQIVIAHNYLSAWSRQASNANTPMTWSSDTLSFEVTITAGTT